MVFALLQIECIFRTSLIKIIFYKIQNIIWKDESNFCLNSINNYHFYSIYEKAIVKTWKPSSVQLMDCDRIFVCLQFVQIVPPNVEPFEFIEEWKPRGEFAYSIREYFRQLLARHKPHFTHFFQVWLNLSVEVCYAEFFKILLFEIFTKLHSPIHVQPK